MNFGDILGPRENVYFGPLFLSNIWNIAEFTLFSTKFGEFRALFWIPYVWAWGNLPTFPPLSPVLHENPKQFCLHNPLVNVQSFNMEKNIYDF